MRRPRPTRTRTRPVANGSSVPACPARRSPRPRRTRTTRSWDVLPAGLSARTRPSIGRRMMAARSRGVRAAGRWRRAAGLQLGGDLLAEEGQELLVAEARGEPGRLAVPAAPGGARDERDVDAAVRGAQGDLLAAAARLADQLARQ